MIIIDSVDTFTSRKIFGLKASGKTVGLCHGGFDLLHPGHIKHFESAKTLCDYLFVSVTSDRFVAGRKGSGRPVLTDRLRAYSVAALEFVDYVVITDYQKGVEVIEKLKPSFYIKGPDYKNKTTPGITAEREAIKSVGGEIRYTDDPTFSTTEMIRYIREEMDRNRILVAIDRDGTLIENDDFFGKNQNWREELRLKKTVIDLLSFLQTKYNATSIVVSNQAGVARKFFDCKRVEEINSHLDSILREKGIKIHSWMYCPDADARYAAAKKDETNFDFAYVKEVTKRKPSPDMVFDALKGLHRALADFCSILVIGNRQEDKELALALGGLFVDASDKYEEAVNKINDYVRLESLK